MPQHDPILSSMLKLGKEEARELETSTMYQKGLFLKQRISHLSKYI